jgi:hypothetical protein
MTRTDCCLAKAASLEARAMRNITSLSIVTVMIGGSNAARAGATLPREFWVVSITKTNPHSRWSRGRPHTSGRPLFKRKYCRRSRTHPQGNAFMSVDLLRRCLRDLQFRTRTHHRRFRSIESDDAPRLLGRAPAVGSVKGSSRGRGATARRVENSHLQHRLNSRVDTQRCASRSRRIPELNNLLLPLWESADTYWRVPFLVGMPPHIALSSVTL